MPRFIVAMRVILSKDMPTTPLRLGILLALLSMGACSDTPTNSVTTKAPETMSTSHSQQTTAKTSETIPVEAVARKPSPGMAMPSAFAFSFDHSAITFLDSADGSLTKQLYKYDLDSGTRTVLVDAGQGDTEENLSAEQKLRRERQRMMSVGVTRYAWAKHGDTMLIPLGGGLSIKDGLDGALRQLDTAGKEHHPVLGPQLSPDGSAVAYVQNAELYVTSTSKGVPKQVTFGARGTGKTNGLAEYIAQEEMAQQRGFWWSTDGTQLAFVEVDETHIPKYRIVHQGQEGVVQEKHAYPFAGAANAKVRLGVVPAKGGDTVWMDLGDTLDIYLARVNWMPDGSLWAQIENRQQTQLDLVRFDVRNARPKVALPGKRILRETTDVWINLHHDLHSLAKVPGDAQNGFLWASERSGYKHLYVYDGAGTLLRQITDGDWMVDRVVDVDAENGVVYFLGSKDSPLESHLYVVSLGGGEIRKITQEPGMHSAVVDSKSGMYLDIWSSKDHPHKVALRPIAADVTVGVRMLHDKVDANIAKYQLTPPEFVSLRSRDGVELHAAMYKPPSSFQAPYPTVLAVYGGPHVQLVSNSWRVTADMRIQYLRSLGFLVFTLDNRGSSRRGLAFEGAIRHDMGHVEIADQVDGVGWLVEQQLADKDRVGIMGWSYGGYMAAMALARAPETFQAAVSGAPVTHWDGYDTHYTERYMGTPQSNPKGYLESSIMHHVDKITGDLLLVHGLIDENVHFRHTARLINSLIKAGKDYTLQLFPNERHSPRSLQDRVYMENRITRFLQKHLGTRKRAPVVHDQD